MFRELERALAAYESAVLSYRDLDGYPMSLRVKPRIDRQSAVIRLGLSARLSIAGAPASLLAHAHDDALWNQTSILVRGRLVPESDTHVFVPTSIVAGVDRSALSFVRFVVRCRSATRAYLASRGLARPEVPWDDVRRLVQRARRNG